MNAVCHKNTHAGISTFLLNSLLVLSILIFIALPVDAAQRSGRFDPPGHRVDRLPRGHVTINIGRDPYRYYGGVFYRPYQRGYVVIRAPIGARVRTIPAGYISFGIGARRYYYINSTYYLWEPRYSEYVVVEKPDGAASAINSAGRTATVQLYVYPSAGQTVEQTGQDKYECYVWASEQSDYDPAVVNENPDRAGDYNRAFSACLEGRGYTVR